MSSKKYFYEGVAYELAGFEYKRQVTFEDCRRQFLATLLGNRMRLLSNASRKNGLPDEFGEGLARHYYPSLVSFKSKTGKKGDMLNEASERLEEIKTATSDAPTSFSPTSKSEVYIFCDFNMDTSEHQIYKIYNSILITAKINKHTTLGQQRSMNEVAIAEKKTAPRPRFSLRKFVKKEGIKPDFSGILFEKCDIEEALKDMVYFWRNSIEILLENAK